MKKSLTDPEVFFTNLSLGPMAGMVSLMTRNEREEREELARMEYRSMLFGLFDDE